MTHSRRPLSLAASLALGLGAVLLVLFGGGAPAAAAPAPAGLNPPLPTNCFARDDSNSATVYSSPDSAAVRSAVAAAVTSDTVRLAGTCNGVAAQGGTTQTVVITKALNLVGGFSIADWTDSFPITQPTILDAQGLGRVITASASITLADLTIQNGDSFGHAGGGIFARLDLTLFGTVNILSNTALVSTTANSAPTSILAPSQEVSPFGGGGFVDNHGIFHPAGGNLGPPAGGDTGSVTIPAGHVTINNNSGQTGGGLWANNVFAPITADEIRIIMAKNYAQQFGGGLFVLNNLTVGNILFVDNHSDHFGGGWDVNGPATLTNLECQDNTAGGGACGASAGYSLTMDQCSMSGDAGIDGAALDIFDAITQISRCSMTNEKATGAGGAIYASDAPLYMVNNLFIADTAPKGGVLYAERFLASSPPVVKVEHTTAVRILFGFHTAAESINPLASPAVLTGSAFAASGVSLFITDTIVASYTLAYETSQSGTISGDYNLFEHTPVISGTNITTGTHSLVGDPLFADDLGHLSAGSPAIDHGIDVGLTTDLDGNHRPSGHGFDIGAFEYQFPQIKLFLPLLQR